MRCQLERVLARHCGPVLMGVKPSAMFPLPSWLGEYRCDLLTLYGLRYVVLKRSAGNRLAFVYRRDLLTSTLSNPAAQSALAELAYPLGGSAETLLGCLARRVFIEPGFPHEAGFFLGYPPEDVLGFIRNKGMGFKLCGQWKVYGDEKKALALFAEYARCKDCLLDRLETYGTILENGRPFFTAV
ncbi:MAG: DUF3793 family protein [Clostridiales bacterium]|nr:DUF3793 family protein [Clostridiales bacterium]